VFEMHVMCVAVQKFSLLNVTTIAAPFVNNKIHSP
jgi:hypothetical protein